MHRARSADRAQERTAIMSRSFSLVALSAAAATSFFISRARADEPAAATPPAGAEAKPAEGAAAPAPAGDAKPAAPAAEEPKKEYKPRPSPYSLPWQLRSVMPVSVVRSDTVIAMGKTVAVPAVGPAPAVDPKNVTTIVTGLIAAYKLTPEIQPFIRLAWVKNTISDVPATSIDPSGTALANPVIGANYLMKLSPELRLAATLGFALPLGQGGGDKPAATDTAALETWTKANTTIKSAIYARSAMDNAMFAPNYLTVFPGVGLAWIKDGLTIQVEATVLILRQMRDKSDDPAVNYEKDGARTNLTSGLHVGYFLIKELSVGAELRYQRWLTTPYFMADDNPATQKNDDTKAAAKELRDQATFAIGLRGHFKLGEGMWLRPGLSYSRGIDNPMASASTPMGPIVATKYNIVQLDIPFIF
jgi:hypothetical protein